MSGRRSARTGSISSSATSRPSCCARASCSPTSARADDGWEVLREVAEDERRLRDGARWSYCRDFGGTRLIVLDSRCGRVLEEGRRSILDDAEWEWLERHLEGDFDHLLIATSDPVVLAPGAPSRRALGRGDRRRGLGPAAARSWGSGFAAPPTSTTGPRSATSFERLMGLLARAGGGRVRPGAGLDHVAIRRRPPRLSGRARVSRDATGSRAASGRRSARRTATRSRAASARRSKLGDSAARRAIFRGLARLAGVAREPVRWRLVEGPFYDNQVATPDDRRAAPLSCGSSARSAIRRSTIANSTRRSTGRLSEAQRGRSESPVSIGWPSRRQVPTPPLPTWTTCVEALALEDRGGEARALAAAADGGDRPVARAARRARSGSSA